jgi:Protein of unknown function (DUF2800)
MAPSAHSAFSASASARLLACPAAYALALAVSDGKRRSSVYAAEGTLAHSLAEACLQTGVSPETFVGDARVADGFEFTVDEEMSDAVATYMGHVNTLKALGYSVALEVRVSPSDLWPDLPAPSPPIDLFGTSDVVAYNPAIRDLQIVDLKYGEGIPVEATWNTQLLYYAAGALGALRAQGRIVDTVTATIVQPRAFHPVGRVRSHTYTAAEVEAWAREVLYVGILLALDDNGATKQPGTHCRFCPASAQCPALRDLSLDTARQAFLAAPTQNLPASAPTHAALPDITLSNAALGDLLNKIELVTPWLEAVKRLGLERLEADVPVPGWKLVAKRASRQWVEADQTAMLETLDRAGVDVDALVDVVLPSPAQVEKKLGAKRYKAEIAPHVALISSGKKIAPELGPQSAASRRTAQEAFGLLPALPAATP